ncbi:Asp-tRNA(Asn)/Glu-tRNA(Gln) amidotransferase subunit GatA [Myxococcota bacterium]|nr:Asp-tRNA(Asn)/Glu-tRNA(Gln) amidotransferase subunit GatA [Myxococcota bacterium]
MDPCKLTAVEIARAVRARELTAVAVWEAFEARIRRYNPVLNAFLHINAQAAAEAAEIDRRVAAGEDPGPLCGVPVAVKDNIVTTGMPTTCASRILEGWVSPYDATVVKKLKAAGAVIAGKTNLDEFAMGGSNENSAFGVVRNPWDLRVVPGGSSGGSAAAVAARLVPLALGSDTGGSVRQPASFTNLYGLKPTYGRVSRSGLVAFASSLDQIGPLARTAADAQLLYEALAGHDPLDSTSLTDADLPAAPDPGDRPLRIGVVREFFAEGLDPQVRAVMERALESLKAAGAGITEVSLPSSRFGIAIYYLLATSEASSNLSRYDGVRYSTRAPDAQNLEELYSRTRGHGFGPEVKRRILLGTYALSAGYYDAYYRKAQQVRTLIRREVAAAFETCDLLFGPTVPTPPFAIGALVDDPLSMYLSDMYAVVANLAGVPALSVPAGFADVGPSAADGVTADGVGTMARLPVGMQFLAKPGHENTLFALSRLWERLAPDLITHLAADFETAEVTP